MRAILRIAAALCLSAPLLLLNTPPASAVGSCYLDLYGLDVVDPPPVYYPAPTPDDQPQATATPVWVATDDGPGWHSCTWSFIRVQQGTRVFVANAVKGKPNRFHGEGFDSGILPDNTVGEVFGTARLKVGRYYILDIDNYLSGWLYVDPCTTNCLIAT